MDNGLENLYRIKNNKKLYYGYTTGSCAAAASKAATLMLISGKEIESVKLMTPKGILLNLGIEDILITDIYVSCAVRKYSGDDPDVTHGTLVYAKVTKDHLSKDIHIDGGLGIGRVTRKGLEQEVGQAAINKVPRKMIVDAVSEILEDNDYHFGINVIISVPEGKELAKKTFNPRLGIEGGISILGTSGIVEPMSERALLDSIKVELKMLRANGKESVVITPGNYGNDFSISSLEIPSETIVKCSNFIGDTIDMLIELEFKEAVFIGHIGKFVKLAGGIMNTHSRWADSRMEILAANAILAGATVKEAKEIMECINTDDGIEVLEASNLTSKVLDGIVKKIEFYINNRAYEKLDFGTMVFSNRYGILGKTEKFENILKHIKETN